MHSLRDRKIALLIEKRRRRERAPLEADLYAFVKSAWPHFDPTPFEDHWSLKALCQHLEAVSRGEIKRLLINFPPRCAKSNIVSICWQAWTWVQPERTYLMGPQVRFLCGSYNQDLSLKMSRECRKLMRSHWFQRLWGDRIAFAKDDDSKQSFSNSDGGARFSTSVSGTVIGRGGDVIVIDDPHNTKEVESDADRAAAENWWLEVSTTRRNNPLLSPLVVVMQRLHELDTSGIIMDSPSYKAGEWVHLMIPMRHDVDRHCVTPIWEDPRSEPGELMWPERFTASEVNSIESGFGPYLFSGRYQQSPSPPKGGIIQADWWQIWDSGDGNLPKCHFKLASADTAFTEREQNDPTGFTVWGVFYDPVTKHPRVCLLYAWRKRLKTKGKDVERLPGETLDEWRKRARPGWGLVEWIRDSCQRYRVNTLMIEDKANGIMVAEEMQRLHSQDGVNVITKTPEGDKSARAHNVVGLFTSGLVYAPDTTWADLVIQEAANFPKGRYKDLTDSTTQALKWLRDNGFLEYDKEIYASERRANEHREQLQPLYPI